MKLLALFILVAFVAADPVAEPKADPEPGLIIGDGHNYGNGLYSEDYRNHGGYSKTYGYETKHYSPGYSHSKSYAYPLATNIAYPTPYYNFGHPGFNRFAGVSGYGHGLGYRYPVHGAGFGYGYPGYGYGFNRGYGYGGFGAGHSGFGGYGGYGMGGFNGLGFGGVFGGRFGYGNHIGY